MIIDDVKSQAKEAMKAKDSAKTSILRLVIGTVQQSGDESDESVEKVIRKLIKSNTETIVVASEQSATDQVSSLSAENSLLESFLPKSMNVDEIIAFISDNNIDVTGHEGKAMGAVMKALKSNGATVQGSDVKIAIAKVRQ